MSHKRKDETDGAKNVSEKVNSESSGEEKGRERLQGEEGIPSSEVAEGTRHGFDHSEEDR